MITRKGDGIHKLYLPSALMYMALILLMSSTPGVIPDDAALPRRVFVWLPPSVQNFLHVPVYAGLAFLWCAALSLRLSRYACIVSGFFVAVSFGMVDEWYQSFIPGRIASLSDMAANALGGAIGVGVYAQIFHPKNTRRLNN